LLDALPPRCRVIAQMQLRGSILEHRTRDARLAAIALRRDDLERVPAKRIDVSDDAASERLHVEQRVLRKKLLDPFAAGAMQARLDVGDRLVEREPGEPMMNGCGRPLIEMLEHACDQILVA